MAVFQRATSKGHTQEYHFKFMFKRKTYYGVCEGCTTKVKAEAYEKLQIETLKRGSEQRTAKAYAENLRDLLTGGHEIKLSEVFQLAMSKPRKRAFSEKQGQRKQAIFDDFIAFMTEKYPDIVNVPQVQVAHAEEYIAFIREHGRFSKDVVYERAGKSLQWKTPEKLSNKTANDFLMICKEVFSLVMRDCGLLDNPFNFIPKLSREETCREAFSEEEIKAIRNSKNDFCRNLFNIGFVTYDKAVLSVILGKYGLTV
ncbi:MAG: hypothetical protein BWY31_00308 [Lentisphaerae bacterium ADurb.Bin242]|nr:MAG: hypothetical protein BWY31_00308 [Lentisphaerae bacterium ADurb.Bin242]